MSTTPAPRRRPRLLALALIGGVLSAAPGTAQADHGYTVPAGPVHDAWQALGEEEGRLGHAVAEHTCGLVRGGCHQRFEHGFIYTTPNGAVIPMPSWNDRVDEYTDSYLDLTSIWLEVEGGETGALGYPTQVKQCTATRCAQLFERGQLVAHSDTGHYVLRSRSAIDRAWLASGGESGPFGRPYSAETCTADGKCQREYETLTGQWNSNAARRTLYSTPKHGAHTIPEYVGTRHVQFAAEYQNAEAYDSSADAPNPLGHPTSTASCTARGCVQRFEHGRLVRAAGSARTVTMVPGPGPTLSDPFAIHSPAAARWLALGGETGPIGHPTGGYVCASKGVDLLIGCMQRFQGGLITHLGSHEGFSPRQTLGTWVVTGRIGERYQGIKGHADMRIGLPRSNTRCGLRNGGCSQAFTSASMYWSPRTGARLVKGVILTRWLKAGGVNSRFGYPIAEQRKIRGGVQQKFSGGTLTHRNGRWV